MQNSREIQVFSFKHPKLVLVCPPGALYTVNGRRSISEGFGRWVFLIGKVGGTPSNRNESYGYNIISRALQFYGLILEWYLSQTGRRRYE
jgi:hypothetical protein